MVSKAAKLLRFSAEIAQNFLLNSGPYHVIVRVVAVSKEPTMFDVLVVAAVLMPLAVLAAAIGGWLPEEEWAVVKKPRSLSDQTFADVEGRAAHDKRDV